MSNVELLGKKREPHNVIRAEVQRSGEQCEHVAQPQLSEFTLSGQWALKLQTKVPEDFTIKEKTPTRAGWLAG